MLSSKTQAQLRFTEAPGGYNGVTTRVARGRFSLAREVSVRIRTGRVLGIPRWIVVWVDALADARFAISNRNRVKSGVSKRTRSKIVNEISEDKRAAPGAAVVLVNRMQVPLSSGR